MQIKYSALLGRSPRMTASVCLPAFRSFSRSRKLFTTRMAVMINPGGTAIHQAAVETKPAWWMAFPPGLIITAILVVNNLRDLENDRKAGKHTLAVILGERGSKVEYLICMIAAYLVMPLAAGMGIVPWLTLITWACLPLAIRTARIVLTQKGRPLNAALAGTGQVALLFSILFWIGLVLR